MAKNREPMTGFQKAIEQALGEGRTFGAEGDPAREKYPRLWEWMTTAYLKGGYTKQPAILTVALGPEGVLVSLTDRDLCVRVETCCQSLLDALEAMEKVLCQDNPPIKNWGKREPHLRKRKQQ